MQPKLTVSGFRGIWGDTLTEDIAQSYTRAFGMFVSENRNEQQTIFLARDGRESGPALATAVTEELLSSGFNVVDLGMMATPVVVFLVKSEKADGAIIITASHNPVEYNGLKFVTRSGLFASEEEVAKIKEFHGQQPPLTTYGSRSKGDGLFEKYLEKLLSSVHTEGIKLREFKVALDPINSVGCTTTPKLLEALGVQSFVINGEPTGKFAHEPEPLPKNLSGLSLLVKENKCDVGFAQDPDGDRLVICDENGAIPSEETMLALCVKAILAKGSGDIVVNLSTSNMSEDLAAKVGRKTFRSKVGEVNVLKMVQENKAILGGEGSGGIIWPEVNTARDSYVGIALILELMAEEEKPLSGIIADLPCYFMHKEKLAFAGDLAALFSKINDSFPDGKDTIDDGLRLDFSDRSWVHIRASNTEPVVRIIAEAKTKDEAELLVKKAHDTLNSLLS